MPTWRKPAGTTLLFLLLLLISAAVKLYAARLMAWEADYVPLIARGQAWLDGGPFPVVGTLSSVAAYNMPFLAWMQLPALMLTRDVRVVLVATQLAFNLISTWAIFRLGRRIFDARAGLAAAIVFAFSDVGISSAYTAWAQLLLPGFFALVSYSLFSWLAEGRAWQLALCLILATCAFMTHFSAVLLYGILLALWLVLRPRVDRRGLISGCLLSALMLAPYLAFEASRDFADVRAFLTRRSRLSAEVLAEYAQLKPGGPAVESPAAAEPALSASASADQSTRLERGIAWALSIPAQIIRSLRLFFDTDLASLKAHAPLLHPVSSGLRVLLEACFWLGSAGALYACGRGCTAGLRALPADQRNFQRGWQLARAQLLLTAAGRNLILLLIVLGTAAGLILARAGPAEHPSYYAGIVSLQLLICGYAAQALRGRFRLQRLLLAALLLLAGLGALDRVARVARHDPTQHSPLNLNLYTSHDAAAAWIASDWRGPAQLTVSYDMFPELAQHWWVVAWHRIDSSYRIGMALDYLLGAYHGLHNQNKNPAGLADAADYIVTSASGSERYDLQQYDARQFGALFVLKAGADP